MVGNRNLRKIARYFASSNQTGVSLLKLGEGVNDTFTGVIKKLRINLLAHKKVNRGKRYGRRKRSCKYKMLTSIHERPSHVLDREELGHWEGDTIAFSNFHHKNVTTLVERKTRFTMLCQNQTRKSQEVMGTIQNVIKL